MLIECCVCDVVVVKQMSKVSEGDKVIASKLLLRRKIMDNARFFAGKVHKRRKEQQRMDGEQQGRVSEESEARQCVAGGEWELSGVGGEVGVGL